MYIKLNPELAQRFIKRIAKYTEYNVNIMDATGHIITSSRNPERIGTFHEGAYHMIQEHQEIMMINSKSDYLGVKNGVNLLLSFGKEILGVVGVTGKPEQVRDIAMIIKMAMETMIIYEESQSPTPQRLRYEPFYIALFEDKPVSQEKLEVLAEQLDFDSKCIRIPIILLLKDTEKSDNVLAILHSSFLRPQDFCWFQSSHRILVYKKLDGTPEEIFSDWKLLVSDWLESLLLKISCAKILVGTLQCRLHYYHKGVEHCEWLEKSISCQDPIIFFSDYVGNFLDSLMPIIELNGLYNVYDRYLTADFKNGFQSMIGSLRDTNYNLVASSQQMFVHKNTLAFRLNKIKSLFTVNPFQSNRDRQFLEGFYLYLKQKIS